MSFTSNYVFRVPVASSIVRQETFEETLLTIIGANQCRPAHKRLPMEILLLVNEQIHTNPIYEEIRFIWEPVITNGPTSEFIFLTYVLLDENKKFHAKAPEHSNCPIMWGTPGEKTGIYYWCCISAADLLYRIRCFFPEVYVRSVGRDGYKSVWSTQVRHKQTGLRLLFSEHKGAAEIAVQMYQVSNTQDAVDAFMADAMRLLNTFFETVDGKRFSYFHPAAYGDYPSANDRFVAVPDNGWERLDEEEELSPYIPWNPVKLSMQELSSSRSLLRDMKYNIRLRKVVNGSACLTTIISSSLLFYRLLCHFAWTYPNVNVTPPITSVWQVKLQHIKTGASVIFMDDHGLFDIRAGEGADWEEMMDDLVVLVTALCSDECTHTYDCTIAGCVA